MVEEHVCRWACSHTLRDHVRNDDIRERLKVENIREVQERKTEVVWPSKEARPILRRKKDSADGTTWEKKKTGRTRHGYGWTVSTETGEPSER